MPIDDSTFCPAIDLFRVAGVDRDTVFIKHHFVLPDLNIEELGKPIYRKTPWAIYRQGSSWIYLGISPEQGDPTLHQVAVFNHEHTLAQIYNPHAHVYRQGGLTALTMFPTDQILVARLLANRYGCYLHSAGTILNGAGMLFVGHSEAGKSTITKLLMAAGESQQADIHQARQKVEMLCDDRNIVRRWDNGWRVYGTWSHGEIPDVSPASAPLQAIFFLEKGHENTLARLTDRLEINRRLLSCVIRPFVTADWWQKTLSLIENLSREIPCYVMRFDKSGRIISELRKLSPEKMM